MIGNDELVSSYYLPLDESRFLHRVGIQHLDGNGIGARVADRSGLSPIQSGRIQRSARRFKVHTVCALSRELERAQFIVREV